MAKCTVNINAAIPILVYFDCRVDRLNNVIMSYFPSSYTDFLSIINLEIVLHFLDYILRAVEKCPKNT